MKRIIAVLLSCAAVLLAAGCERPYKTQKVKAEELTANMRIDVEEKELSDEFISAYDDFTFGFFKRVVGDGNSLISPLSASMCLAMAFNGASGETLKEFEEVFGGISIADQNEFYRKIINSADEKLKIADSVWLNAAKPAPEEDFLRAVKSYYDSEVYRATFDDELVSDINNWAANKTDGMIKKMIERTSPEFYMYLMNALYFSSKWEEEYDKEDIEKRDFTCRDGSVRQADMMYSTENDYISLNGADGFLKYYKGGKYAFLALLPQGDESVVNFAYSLTAENFKDALKNKKHAKINAGIPKFSYDYGIEMKELLMDMGLNSAFSPLTADFTKMSGHGDIWIDFVLQKTKIEVDEKGTKAAAVTIIGMKDAAYMPEERKTIILDRPFVYAIIAVDSGLPLFIGCVNEI